MDRELWLWLYCEVYGLAALRGISEFCLAWLELASTHIGTAGSWSSRARTARMNAPETRSDTYTGPSLRHRTHPDNLGLSTGSLRGKGDERECGFVCVAFVFGWYIVFTNSQTMHKTNSDLADRQPRCDDVLVFVTCFNGLQRKHIWAELNSWVDLSVHQTTQLKRRFTQK